MATKTTAVPIKVRPPKQRRSTRPLETQGRSRDLLASGTHPVTLLPLLESGGVHDCGECVHRFTRQLDGGGSRNKCSRAASRRNAGPDVPADYPACSAFGLTVATEQTS